MCARRKVIVIPEGVIIPDASTPWPVPQIREPEAVRLANLCRRAFMRWAKTSPRPPRIVLPEVFASMGETLWVELQDGATPRSLHERLSREKKIPACSVTHFARILKRFCEAHGFQTDRQRQRAQRQAMVRERNF